IKGVYKVNFRPYIYVISDSVGETAELVMKAGLSQFTNEQYILKRIPYVDSKKLIDQSLQEIEGKKGIIGFTLVDPTLMEYLVTQAELMNIQTIDIMGPVLKPLETLFNKKPLLEPGLVHTLDEDYFKRVEAIEFAVKYDDAQDVRGI